MWGERGGSGETARAPQPLFGVQISPGDAESLWSCPPSPDPSSGVWAARADGEEGGPKEKEGGQKEGYPEEEMSGLKKQKQLTRVCAATNPSPGYAANGRGDSRPERSAGEAACVWDYGLNYV